jgi:hypothetical protein
MRDSSSPAAPQNDSADEFLLSRLGSKRSGDPTATHREPVAQSWFVTLRLYIVVHSDPCAFIGRQAHAINGQRWETERGAQALG